MLSADYKEEDEEEEDDGGDSAQVAKPKSELIQGAPDEGGEVSFGGAASRTSGPDGAQEEVPAPVPSG